MENRTKESVVNFSQILCAPSSPIACCVEFLPVILTLELKLPHGIIGNADRFLSLRDAKIDAGE